MKNGLEQDAIPLFLSFLNDMGMVLWLDETGLRDVVIWDIITSFVEPATRIICNHISKTKESTVHHKDIKKYFKKKRKTEWDKITKKGIVDKCLLTEILQFRDGAEDLKYDTGIVVNMMLKYGLMVTLEQAQEQAKIIKRPANPLGVEPNELYLVPALLPNDIGHCCAFNDKNWIEMQQFKRCYYIFSADKEFHINENRFPSN